MPCFSGRCFWVVSFFFVPVLDDDIGFARALGAGADELDDAWVCGGGNGTGLMGEMLGVLICSNLASLGGLGVPVSLDALTPITEYLGKVY